LLERIVGDSGSGVNQARPHPVGLSDIGHLLQRGDA
jgi:hypothetical protein